MIALLRSTDGNPDSRFEKYTDFLQEKQIDYITLCWDRLGVKIPMSNKLYYKKKSSYGLRFGNIRNLLGFNWFLLKKLIQNRKRYKVIHAADFDTILPAIAMKILFGKKIIYDIYDWYIDSRGLYKSNLRYLIKWIEYLNIKLSDMVIICEPERNNQIIYKPKNLKVLPNIPSFKQIMNIGYEVNKNITIGYVGILGGQRGLENLINLVENNPDVIVEAGGFGPLEAEFLKANKKLNNLHFHGRMKYKDALVMLSNVDVVYAMYERTNPNHILAAPNKYYESLYLGKPIITTTGTLVGDKVEKYKTGFTIDEKYESLEILIKDLDSESLKNISANAKSIWESKYKTFVTDFLNNEYLPFIEKLNSKS